MEVIVDLVFLCPLWFQNERAIEMERKKEPKETKSLLCGCNICCSIRSADDGWQLMIVKFFLFDPKKKKTIRIFAFMVLSRSAQLHHIILSMTKSTTDDYAAANTFGHNIMQCFSQNPFLLLLTSCYTTDIALCNFYALWRYEKCDGKKIRANAHIHWDLFARSTI